jgi:threonine aldolase
LKVDNDRAKQIGELLADCPYVESIRPVQTNILIFDLKAEIDTLKFLQKLEDAGIHAVQFGPKTIRFVFHLDITDEMMKTLTQKLPTL